MVSQGPLITSAGKDHLIMSKQLCIVITVVVMCGGFLFYRMEQAAVKQSYLTSQHVTEQNEALKMKNKELLDAKSQLEKDEEELTKMYDKWLSDDNEDLKITKQQIEEIQAKIDAVQASQSSKEDALSAKELTLAGKEDVLSDLHMQLRAKNSLMKMMKKQIQKLNGTIPTMIEEMPDDDDWAW